MKMKLLLIAAVLLGCCSEAFAWGKTGHDAIAYIAESHLTPKARKAIEKYLDGRSIVYYASWMDQVRYTPPYRHTSSWHGAGVDSLGRYLPSEGGADAVSAIADAVGKLRNYRHQDDSTVVVAIRCLVHLVADMHCPVHVHYPLRERYSFVLDGREHEIHAFWDSAVLELNHRWSMEDYRRQLDRCSRREREALMVGTPSEWLEQSARDCRVLYTWVRPGQKIDKKHSGAFLLQAQPLAEQQVLRAGYRLARILNDIFG